MQMRGRVVARVDAGQGVADALAEESVRIGAAHAVVDGNRKRLARQVHVLSQLH